MNAKHRADREKQLAAQGKSRTTKAMVVALIEERSGEVAPNVQASTLRREMAENVNRFGSILHTDTGSMYTNLGRQSTQHHAVDQHVGQYVDKRTRESTNKAENFFSQLKRSINGTHHHVSLEHLDRYVAEFAFRHSTHKMADSERISRRMGLVPGRRIVYKRIVN